MYKSLLLEVKIIELDPYAHTVAHDLKQPVYSLIRHTSIVDQEIETLDKHMIKELVHLIDKSAKNCTTSLTHIMNFQM